MSILWNHIIGHKEQISFIQTAFKKRRLAQVFLLSGTSGIGKKLFALSMSQSLICKKSRSLSNFLPCGQCLECLRVEEMKSEHLFFIQPEGEKEIKRKDVLKIFDFLSLKSRFSLPRIVLMDQAHKMNLSSANILLKILEEPPENGFLFLITDSFFKILSTIRSRAQGLRFRNLYPDEMNQIVQSQKKHLKDAYEDWMFQAAQGHMEALQTLAVEKPLKKRAFAALKEILVLQDTESAFQILEKDIADKEKSLRILFFWKQGLRDAYVYKALCRKEDMIHRDEISLIQEIGLKKPLDEIQNFFESVKKLEKSVFYHLNRNLSFKNFFFSNRKI